MATNGSSAGNPSQEFSPSSEPAATTVESQQVVTSDEPAASNRSFVVVYDVEHLATFSTGNQASGGRKDDAGVKDNQVEDNGPARQQRQHKGQLNNDFGSSEPKVALQRLFELEKLSGIWTQRMQIELRSEFMLIVDCETNSIVERFERQCVGKPEAFSQYSDIYNNIVVFTIRQRNATSNNSATGEKDAGESSSGDEATRAKECELHIFQCVSHDAQQLVSHIKSWKLNDSFQSSEINLEAPTTSSPTTGANQSSLVHKNKSSTKATNQAKVSSSSSSFSSNCQQKEADRNNKSDHMSAKPKPASDASSPPTTGASKPVVTVATSTSESVPLVNVNVKETVQVFNQIAALREKSSKPSSPTTNQRPNSDTSGASSQATSAETSAGQLYKQRSIRATLAPKFLANGETNKSQDTQPTPSSSSASASAEAKHNQSTHVSANDHHDSDQFKNGEQQAASPHSSPSTAHSQANGSGGSQSGQPHKGSKSSSASSSRSQANKQHQHHHNQRPPQLDSTRSHASSSSAGQMVDQVTTNESYVSVLNHCFDDIEKFIIRIQQAAAAYRELHAKKKLSKRSSNQILASQTSMLGSGKDLLFNGKSNGLTPPAITASELAMLSARARGPSEEDYFDILSKFKLAFNLLAKLKGCIHEPNAPELVHFLFTPLAIIIDSARNVSPPIDPTIVGIPYLNQDALDLLSNCCTSKESDMWLSLGPEWTQTIDPLLLTASRLPTSFQPIFSDGWAPVINELELIGLVAPADRVVAHHHQQPSFSSANEGRNHHRLNSSHYKSSSASAMRRHTSHAFEEPLPPPLPTGYPMDSGVHPYPAKNGAKLHSSGRQVSKRRVSPSPPDGMVDPFIDQDYGPHDVGVLGLDSGFTNGYRNSEPSRGGDGRFGPAPRRGVPHRQLPDEYDAPVYPLSPVGHQMSNGHLEYSKYPNTHPDDYTELADHHLDDFRRYRSPVPSSSGHQRHSRGSKAHSRYSHPSVWPPPDQHELYDSHPERFETDNMSDLKREAMLLDLGPAQTEWFFELQSRGAMIVRVLFTRDANNDKELSVRRGELLEVLDDSRKWWRARNINLEVAHVPHTIVAVMQGYQTIDELLAHNPASLPSNEVSPYMAPQRLPKRNIQSSNYLKASYGDQQNSKAAGAFRYF